MQLILISGLSGSGKSIVLAVLEDCGYYCVDNLPVQLLPDTIHHLRDAGCGSVAVSVDVRSGAGLQQLPEHARVLKEEGIDVRVLFLEANTETLVKRFSETRRRHPLSDANKTLPEAIQLEREMLEEIGWLGHNIDTTELSPNTLRAWVKDFIALDRSRLTLLFESFGFKHGIPLDADFMFDVRCLPNPHYDPRLRPLTGRDEPVIAFMEANADAQKMLADIGRYVEDWLPCFIRDNRNYLTVALGCTGGQHRSVYFVEKLAARFHGQIQVLVRHRELA